MSFDLGLLGSFGPAAILLSMIGVSNSTGGLTHPIYPTGPGPTAGRPDYSGGRRQVFFSRIRSGRFSLGSSPQNPKKPESTELYSIFRWDFLDPARFQLDPWNLHRIWRHLVVYAQIQLQSNGFFSNKARSVENMMRFAQIWRNSDGFYSNPAKLRWYLLKSGDDLVYFCLDLVIFAKIRWRFEFFLLRSSDFCTNSAKIRWKIQIAVKMESPASSSSASTDLTADQATPIRPDPLVFTVGGGFTRRKPDVIGSVPGWAQTRPGPTRGHPYSIT